MSEEGNLTCWSFAFYTAEKVPEVMEETSEMIIPKQLLMGAGDLTENSFQVFKPGNREKSVAVNLNSKLTTMNGNCHVPRWIMEYLDISVGDQITLLRKTRNTDMVCAKKIEIVIDEPSSPPPQPPVVDQKFRPFSGVEGD